MCERESNEGESGKGDVMFLISVLIVKVLKLHCKNAFYQDFELSLIKMQKFQ